MRRVCCALALIVGFTPMAFADPLGEAPRYTTRTVTAIPNAQAITRRIWVPGLNDGYVPQGLTVVDGALYVSSYRSEDPKQDTGPCRLYRLDTVTGAVTGQLDLPAGCGHAGGLARGPAGRLYVADTRAVFEITIANPPTAAIGVVSKTTKLSGKLKGSFAAGSADAIWLGSYERTEPATLYKIPFAALGGTAGEDAATASVVLPSLAQGAAFDRAGRLWVTRSGSKFGELLQLDPKSGAVLATYAMPAGVEDVSFDADGRLWTLSEAGSKRWLQWPGFYPFVLQYDVTKLKP